MIETRGLTKYFDDFLAVSNVTLDVKSGEILALLGPNGAGKTTTIRMLTSVLDPTEGSASVAGYDVVSQPEYVRAHVGVLTEGHGLYLRMDGREYLDFFGRLYGLSPSRRRQRSEELSERFGLIESLDRRINEYSKGMRQKLALVRSMLHDPPVLLLDEPTSAMDPHSARQVRDAITELRTDGRTVIICTHNLPEAEELSDRIAIIRRGEIIAKGTAQQLKIRLLGYPLMELRLVGHLNGVVEDLSDVVDVVDYGEDWIHYRTEDPHNINPQIVAQLTSQGSQVITLSEVPQKLETVYLRIIQDDQPLDVAITQKQTLVKG